MRRGPGQISIKKHYISLFWLACRNLKSNLICITEVLTYHVVPATVYSAALFLESDEVEVKTVEGATLKIKKQDGLFLLCFISRA